MSDLGVAIDYDNWATDRVAQFCAALPPEQRALTTPGTMGTVEATLIHLVAAKERYASALRGTPPPDDAIRETGRRRATPANPTRRAPAGRIRSPPSKLRLTQRPPATTRR